MSAEIEANGEGALLGAYVASRLLWDVRSDVVALLDAFCTQFYGPAAVPMARYFDCLERAFREARMALTGAVHWIPSIYTPEVLDKAHWFDHRLNKAFAPWYEGWTKVAPGRLFTFEEAEGLAGDSMFGRRVACSIGQMKLLRGYLRTVEEYLNYEASGVPIH